MLIAIDGPSGTGKSTAARALAQHLGARYLDTGAMYRVATLHVLRSGIDVNDATAVATATATLPLEINSDPTSTAVILAGQDVSAEIRGPHVTHNVSAVAAHPQVRTNLVALQRQLAHHAQHCVVEGRDIGTVVLTDAPLKIFMTATPEVRAQRRYEQQRITNPNTTLEHILVDVQRRDHLDSTRATSPLKPADDAVIVDTTTMTLDNVITTLIALAHSRDERTSQ